MWWAIDLLASEYGGGIRAIKEGVYLDELLFLITKINDRRTDNYIIQTNIASFPFAKPEVQKTFINNLKSLKSKSYKKQELDRVGMEALKFAMSQNPRIIVK